MARDGETSTSIRIRPLSSRFRTLPYGEGEGKRAGKGKYLLTYMRTYIHQERMGEDGTVTVAACSSCWTGSLPPSPRCGCLVAIEAHAAANYLG